MPPVTPLQALALATTLARLLDASYPPDHSTHIDIADFAASITSTANTLRLIAEDCLLHDRNPAELRPTTHRLIARAIHFYFEYIPRTQEPTT